MLREQRIVGNFIFIISYGIRLYTRICWACDINNSYGRCALLYLYKKRYSSHIPSRR